MTKVFIGEDCGNSPKNLFIQNLTVAFARGNSKFLLENVSDEIRWNIVGDRLTQGKAQFAEALEAMKNNRVAELGIRHIATHGKSGAVDDLRKMKNGRVFAFCNVYEFKDAKGTRVKEITSYVIETK